MANNSWSTSISRLISGNTQHPSPTTASTSSTLPQSQSQSQNHQNQASHHTQTNQPHRQHQSYHAQSSSRGTPSQSYPSSHSTGPRTASTSQGRPSGSRVTHNEQRYALSALSTSAIPDSTWFSDDFMLGAGMVIIQPSSGKVVLLHSSELGMRGRPYSRWFLPKGRKDVGESLEQAALREAHEESGYRVSFLPVVMPHNAPDPPHLRDWRGLVPVTEPIFISTLAYGRGDAGRSKHGGEYLTFWYIGQIAENAVVEANTRMADEVGYETFLLTIDEALQRLSDSPTLRHIMKVAYDLWTRTVQCQTIPEYVNYITGLHAARAKQAAGLPESGSTDEEADTPALSSGGSGDADDTWEDADTPPALGSEAGTATNAVAGRSHMSPSWR